MSDGDGKSLHGKGLGGRPLSAARLRAMAAWFREFAALASADQRRWQIELAGYYDRLAEERESQPVTPAGSPSSA
jgi:hypothetical protein